MKRQRQLATVLLFLTLNFSIIKSLLVLDLRLKSCSNHQLCDFIKSLIEQIYNFPESSLM